MFLHILLTLACTVVYCASAWILWQHTHRETPSSPILGSAWKLALLGSILHVGLILVSVFSGDEAHISLGSAISMVGWVSVLILLTISKLGNNLNLGTVVLPMAALSTLANATLQGRSYPVSQIPEEFMWHMGLAIPTFGVLAVAFSQAWVLIIQDRNLHSPESARMLPDLPAIQTMESNLFRLTLAGFVLMTVNLGIGMITTMANSGSLLVFSHHVLLSLAAWLGFGGLLLGRIISGWRGQSAARWTIATFVVLFLAYFGTRFVRYFLLSN